MKNTIRSLSILLAAVLALSACSATRPHSPAPAPTAAARADDLTPEMADALARLGRLKEDLRRGEKITNPDKIYLASLAGAMSGDAELLRLLRQSGADLDARNSMTRESALQSAVLEGTTRTVALLLEAGADPNIQHPEHGGSPLYDAASLDRADLAALLLAAGANPNVVEERFGFVPLHPAALDGRTDVIAVLLKAGSDPNIRSRLNGIAPLHMAVGNDHREAAEMLLKAGADPNLRTSEGRTPLTVVRERNYSAMTELLKKYGARE